MKSATVSWLCNQSSHSVGCRPLMTFCTASGGIHSHFSNIFFSRAFNALIALSSAGSAVEVLLSICLHNSCLFLLLLDKASTLTLLLISAPFVSLATCSSSACVSIAFLPTGLHFRQLPAFSQPFYWSTHYRFCLQRSLFALHLTTALLITVKQRY